MRGELAVGAARGRGPSTARPRRSRSPTGRSTSSPSPRPSTGSTSTSALAEIDRVLRPGGGLAIVWNERDESTPWVAEMNEVIEWHERPASPTTRRTDWAAEVGGRGPVHPAAERRRSRGRQPMTPRPVAGTASRSVSYRRRAACRTVQRGLRRPGPRPRRRLRRAVRPAPKTCTVPHDSDVCGARRAEARARSTGGTGTRRDLPWRRTRDPWAVLVSELMLQQTQVPAGRCRGGERSSSGSRRPPSCAAAPVGDVVRAWAGLGYNRRAVNLHRCAARVVERHGGRLPDDLAALLALPGIGPYTARAVLVFAFEHDIGPRRHQRRPVRRPGARRAGARAGGGAGAGRRGRARRRGLGVGSGGLRPRRRCLHQAGAALRRLPAAGPTARGPRRLACARPGGRVGRDRRAQSPFDGIATARAGAGSSTRLRRGAGRRVGARRRDGLARRPDPGAHAWPAPSSPTASPSSPTTKPLPPHADPGPRCCVIESVAVRASTISSTAASARARISSSVRSWIGWATNTTAGVEAEGLGLRRRPRRRTRSTRRDRRHAPALEIGDVVHTARRARPSVGEGLDDAVARRRDLVAQVGGRRLGERRLGEAPDLDAAGAAAAPRPGRGTRRRAAWRCRAGRRSCPRASTPVAQRGRSAGVALGRRIEQRSLHGRDLLRDGLAPGGAVGPAGDDRREQTGPPAGVDEQQPRRAGTSGTSASANACGMPSAMPPAPRTSSAPGDGEELDEAASSSVVAGPARLGEHPRVLGRRRRAMASKAIASFGCCDGPQAGGEVRASDSGSRDSWSTTHRGPSPAKSVTVDVPWPKATRHRQRLPRRALLVLGEAERRPCRGCRASPGRPRRAGRRRRCGSRAAAPARWWRWPGCPGPAR